MTRLLLTKIPFFREIILMSFYCPHCHFKNTEVQSASEIAERGVKNVLIMEQVDDFLRQVVKSDTAVFRVENLDIEIPPGRGKLTNIEGMISEIRSDLEVGQEKRKVEAPDVHEKIETIINSLAMMIQQPIFPFRVSLDDPAGNSWLEPSLLDTRWNFIRTEYDRTAEQNAALGLTAQEDDGEEGSSGQVVPQDSQDQGGGMDGVQIADGVMYTLPCSCPGCAKQAHMHIQMVTIPFFKEVIISSVSCEKCGYRTSDVKTGGEITEKGQRIWLDVKDPTDLRRDILKSETCLLKIPACNVEVVPGTMGGRFTTVEGLLTQIRDDLRGSIFGVDDTSASGGDSMPADRKKGWEEFFHRLDKAINGEMEYTILMEDPLANCYVQRLLSPSPDPHIRTEEYERTEEEEEELGITDMRTQHNADGEYTKELLPRGQAPQGDQAGKEAEREEAAFMSAEHNSPDRNPPDHMPAPHTAAELKPAEHVSATASADVASKVKGATDTAAEPDGAADSMESGKDDFVLVEHDDAEA